MKKLCDCKVCNFVKDYIEKAAKLDLALLGVGLGSACVLLGTIVPRKCNRHARKATGALMGLALAALTGKMLVSFVKNK